MEYIEKQVKGYSKDYKTAGGKTKKTNPSLSIYLGAKTNFTPNQTVIIAEKDYFYSLLNNEKPAKEIESKLADIEKELESSKNEVLELSRINEELNLELFRTKEKLETKDKELTNTNKELREKSNKIESLYGAIVYYKDIIARYRELNIIKRIFKYDVEKDLEKPQLIELELE